MSIKLKDIYLLVLIISTIGLYVAYFVEYVIGILPCPLCVYQRFPYLLFIMVAIIGLGSDHPQNNLRAYLIAISLSAILVAAYHAGVERGYFELSELCRPLVEIRDNLSVSEFTQLLYSKKEATSCNRPTFIIPGLSMTEANLCLNFILLIIFLLSMKLKS